MESNPKIVVLQLKEVIYTALLLLLAILLIVLLIIILVPKDKKATTPTYKAGSYTASLTMNGIPMEIVVTVDKNYIKDISLKNTDDAITTMYPLLIPALDEISKQIIKTQSTNNIYCSDETLYTGTVLINSINLALEKASTP